MSHPVQLYIYDLSGGMAAAMSLQLTGKFIPAIYHTSVVVFGKEIFFGQGVSVVRPPGTTHHGRPLRVQDMGTTEIDEITFNEYLDGIREIYRAEKYHLLEFNCNTFTNDVCNFLVAKSIPQEIINLPADFLSTPFGRQLQPMINQMFAPVKAANAPSATNVASHLSICTNWSSLQSLLQQNIGVFVLIFTHQDAAATAAKEAFENVAAAHSSDQDIAFALVDSHVAGDVLKNLHLRSSDLPSLVSYVAGIKASVKIGVNANDLQAHMTFGMARCQARNSHPHSRLSLPQTKAILKAPPTVNRAKPNWTNLQTKLKSFAENEIDVSVMTDLQTTVEELKGLPEGIFTYISPTPTSFASLTLQKWSESSAKACDTVAFPKLYPFFDLARIACLLALSNPDQSSILDSIASQAIHAAHKRSDNCTDTSQECRASYLTLYRLIAATSIIPSLATQYSTPKSDLRKDATALLISGVLNTDSLVRQEAVNAIENLVKITHMSDSQDIEWQIELFTAALEALTNEKDAKQVLRLVAVLGSILAFSPSYDEISGLSQALEAPSTIEKAKLVLDSEGKALAVEVLSMING